MSSSLASHKTLGLEARVLPLEGVRRNDLLGPYKVIDAFIEEASGIYWFFTTPETHPSYTPALLEDLLHLQQDLREVYARRAAEGGQQIRYVVGGSRIPGVFNLGGDLRLITRLVRAQDRGSLQRYARACIDVLYDSFVNFDLPVVTVALVQGDTLGGGFESALSCDVIVAERSAKFGLPEVLFNLFPGMGAYSFLARRMDAVRAERMILSGRLYEAAELHEMGIVDVLAEDGHGEDAVRDYVHRNRRRHNSEVAVYQTRRRVSPLDYQELLDITEVWVEAALRLGDQDLRKMERLFAAQERRTASRPTAAE
jgi:DSF synthase